MQFVRIFFKAINRLKTLILIVSLFTSLGVNVILFVGGSFFSALNSGFEVITGFQTIANRNKAEIANLSEDVLAERKAKREIRGQLSEVTEDLTETRLANRKLEREAKQLSVDLIAERQAKREIRNQLTQTSTELAATKMSAKSLQKAAEQATAEIAAERKIKRELKKSLADVSATNRQLKSQVRDFAMGLVPFKGQKVALKTAVDQTADTIGKRAVKTAKREVASMPGEAIPYLGTAIIVGVTALEISDLCATLKDMTALKKAFNSDLLETDEELEVCSIKVPPKKEIIATVKASPQKAWIAAKEASPSWEEIKNMEMPDVNWSDLLDETVESGGDLWGSTKAEVSNFGGKVKNWWNKDTGQ